MYNAKQRTPRFRSMTSLHLDYKHPETLRPFLNEFGRIRPRRQTRLGAAKQRELVREVKRARHLALLPFISRD